MPALPRAPQAPFNLESLLSNDVVQQQLAEVRGSRAGACTEGRSHVLQAAWLTAPCASCWCACDPWHTPCPWPSPAQLAAALGAEQQAEEEASEEEQETEAGEAAEEEAAAAAAVTESLVEAAAQFDAVIPAEYRAKFTLQRGHASGTASEDEQSHQLLQVRSEGGVGARC